MSELVTGIFTLGGVALGALLTPWSQAYLERKREKRASDRAKLLIGGELLHAQLKLRSVAAGKNWPPVEDAKAFLPSTAWEENRANLVGNVDSDLYSQLVMAYAILDVDRERFKTANLLGETPLPPEVSDGMRRSSNDLGRLRRKLGLGGGWLDEIHDEYKPQVGILNDQFMGWLAELTDDELKNDDVRKKLNHARESLQSFNHHLGNDDAWAEINARIERRLPRV